MRFAVQLLFAFTLSGVSVGLAQERPVTPGEPGLRGGAVREEESLPRNPRARTPDRAPVAPWPTPPTPPALPAASELPTARSVPERFQEVPLLGGPAEDRARLRQLRGDEPGHRFLLRSTSTLGAADPRPGPFTWMIFQPATRIVYNSALPSSVNDGSLWAGRGLGAEVTFGGTIGLGRLSILIAPQIVSQQNREFQTLPYPIDQEPGRSPFAAPWYYPPESIDRPSRFGDGARHSLTTGQSSVTFAAGPASLGVATENLWWGPGVRTALVMSRNAPGFPHAFAGTRDPIATPLGAIEGRWLVGRLSGSGFFDLEAGPEARSISAFGLTLQPRFDPNLWVGVARAVYGIEPGGWSPAAAFNVFRDVGRPAARQAAGEPVEPIDQVFSLFARWLFPESGFEAYGEWGRTERPASLRDLLTAPHHTQGYALGFQWGRPVGLAALVRVQAEVANLELSSTYRTRPTLSWYTSAAVPAGYTHRGRVIGAATGPGSSSQWLAMDLIRSRWSIGLHAGRVRWDNGIFHRRVPHPTYLGHDVTVQGGLRGGLALGPVALMTELTTAARYNYLFQHQPITSDEIVSVDIRNRTIRLWIGSFGGWR